MGGTHSHLLRGFPDGHQISAFDSSMRKKQGRGFRRCGCYLGRYSSSIASWTIRQAALVYAFWPR